MKKILAVFLLSFLLMGADGKDPVGAAWRKIPVLTEEKALESEIHGVTVGPHDEIAIDFYDGTVYLYDTNGGFLSGYQFPPFHPEPYIIFFEDENGFICHYAEKGDEAYVYNSAGEFCRIRTIDSQTAQQEFLKKSDSFGAVYKVKYGNVVKTHPNGDSTVFFRGYKNQNKNVFFVFILLAILYAMYARGKDINASSRKIRISLKKRFTSF